VTGRGTIALLVTLGMAGCGGGAMVAPLRYEPPALAPEESFRAQAPAATPVVPEIGLPWRLTTLPNGVRVALLERHAMPVVTACLVFDRGAIDAGARVDAYAILSRTLKIGTEARSGPELMDAWAGLGAVHEAALGPDGGRLWAEVGAADFESALALLAETATRPRLSPAGLDFVRSRWMQEVETSRFNRRMALDRNTHALLFGRGPHPYGYHRRHASETSALRLSDLSQLHALVLQPAHATLVVVGDVTPERVDASAARLLGSWAPRAPAPLGLVDTPPPPMEGAHTVHVAWKDESETFVSILARGPGRGDADLAALDILAQSFGGLSSRMRGDVRAERGAAYLFGADVSHYRTASVLTIHAALAAARAMPALRSMLDMIEEVARNGITDAELSHAKTSLLSRWRAQMTTTQGIAFMASEALVDAQPLDDLGRYPARLQAVTLDDVRRVAARYLASSALRLVVAGSPSLWPEVQRLGLGPAERRNEWSAAVP
jgi:zinc protease